MKSKCYLGKILPFGYWTCSLLIMFPLTEKGSLHNFPTSVQLSQMETITNAQSAHQERLYFPFDLWSVWFGSTGRSRLPKPPFIHLSPPLILGRPNSIWEMPLVSVFGPLLQLETEGSSAAKGSIWPHETSRSWSSSEDLQLIMFHKCLQWGTNSFQSLDEAQYMALAGYLKVTDPWGN